MFILLIVLVIISYRYEKAKTDLGAALKVLNDYLLYKTYYTNKVNNSPCRKYKGLQQAGWKS